ncbi:ABC transporter ATP-binding protein [Paenibacillus spongiae]|uniref:ABC transporter ATP-binding protein/permease n=1 Tax=Paenibacillus spongiae TaxID=2909671 RepID=A0ABY5S3P5_9BACL|nr:ABC transporter ATP-binding protein [Paenibacillus spongiae]UVI28521.1 ABC transporter ATP-binding protein/permease [Paenibacillus spongiae]
MKSQRLLVDYLRANWHFYALAVGSTMVANVIQSYYPRLIGSFTDQLQLEQLTKGLIVDYSLLLLGVGIGFGLLAGVGQYLIMRLGRRFEYYTRNRLFDHFTTLGESYYSKHGVGKLLSYVMNDVTAVRESISAGVNQTANATMLIISSLVMMLISSIPPLLIAVCMLPLIAIPFIVIRIGPVIKQRSRTVQESLGQMTESAEEQFGGIRVTKKFAVEPIMRRRFGETVDRIRDNQLSLVRISSLFQAIIPFLGAISVIVTLAFGGYLAIQGQLSIGQFVALTLYVRMMVGPLQQIGNVINTMQRSRASMERLNNLLGMKGEIQESELAKAVALDSTGIRIRHLSFTYPGASKETLHDLNLDIAPGSTIGIIGKTGSGKTTLVKLLLRVYDPPSDTVLFGHTDIREMTLESLRNQIGYVPQDGFLFSTTIRDNISFFRRDSSMDKVERAAKQAQIYGSIVSFPEKFETKLGERGITLSGGQRQRTSLARGLIKNAPILILDDSVSAVDAVTETSIIETIRKERRGKTTLLIAHRISALKHADEIIVLDEGRIVQRGTHGELLAVPGIYRTLHSIQEEGSSYAEGGR